MKLIAAPDGAGGDSSDSTLTNSPPKSPGLLEENNKNMEQGQENTPPGPPKGEKPKLMPKPALKPKPVIPKKKPIPPPRPSVTSSS